MFFVGFAMLFVGFAKIYYVFLWLFILLTGLFAISVLLEKLMGGCFEAFDRFSDSFRSIFGQNFDQMFGHIF